RSRRLPYSARFPSGWFTAVSTTTMIMAGAQLSGFSLSQIVYGCLYVLEGVSGDIVNAPSGFITMPVTGWPSSSTAVPGVRVTSLGSIGPPFSSSLSSTLGVVPQIGRASAREGAWLAGVAVGITVKVTRERARYE